MSTKEVDALVAAALNKREEEAEAIFAARTKVLPAAFQEFHTDGEWPWETEIVIPGCSTITIEWDAEPATHFRVYGSYYKTLQSALIDAYSDTNWARLSRWVYNLFAGLGDLWPGQDQ